MRREHELAIKSWPFVQKILAEATERYGSGRWNFACSADDGDCVTVRLYADESDLWSFYYLIRPILAEASLAMSPIVVPILAPKEAVASGVKTRSLGREVTLENREVTLENVKDFAEDAA
jgi:hypothetical protein